jgi:superfamily II DNA or RNA helicase
MNHLYVYPDIFQKIGEFLDSDDLFSMAVTCKAAYKAFQRPILQAKISWPLLKPKRLTFDQREVIQKMEVSKVPVKLVTANCGAGKSLLAIAYALRKNYEKIFIVVPPNLITMWTNTCIDFFGIKPFVLHNSNPKYNRYTERRRGDIPEDKIFVISYKIFSSTYFPWVDRISNVCYIVDEAHHGINLHGLKCDDLIALSATAFKRDTLTYGIRQIVDRFNVDIDDITFKLDKTVIASKLPEVVHLEPHTWKISENLMRFIIGEKRIPIKKKGEERAKENDMRDIAWIAETLSHTFLQDKTLYLGEEISVSGKTFAIRTHIDKGRSKRDEEFRLFREINKTGFLNWRDEHKAFTKYQVKKYEDKVNEMLEKEIKYRQCLSICNYLKLKKEKGIIFDINITHLPFLYKFLTERGIVCYMFTTHYDVASRQKQLEKFKHDDKAQVLLSSIAMLGEGHNVTEANHVIFLSTFLENNKYYQAIGRCHRYPQNKPVYVHYLFNSALDKAIHNHSQGNIDLSLLHWADLLKI